MKSFLSSLLSLLLLLAAAGVCAADGDLTIVAPPDRSIVESRVISIVVRPGSAAIDDLTITVNKRKPLLRKKSPDRPVVCAEGIQLVPGENRIRVVGRKGGKDVASREMKVFYSTELADLSPPPDFEGYAFHSDRYEEPCRPCHRTDFRGTEDTPRTPADSPCYTCHRSIITTYRFAHGPSAVWSCTACHTLQDKGGNGSRLRADETSCTVCHEDSINLWKSMKHQHGPTAAGKCVTCHNPHASDQPNFLRLETVDLCASCHEEILSRPHVVSTRLGGHPLHISPDPFKPNRDFTCASCHNPHAGESPVFLTNYKSTMTGLSDFCRTCHLF